MSLTPYHHLSRPSTTYPAQLQDRGVPAAFAFILDHFWNHRVVGWAGYLEESLRALDGVWEELADVTTPQALAEWTAGLRLLLSDNLDPWSVQVEQDDSRQAFQDRHMSRGRASFFLGEALFDWVFEDDWRVYYQQLEQRGASYADLDRLHARRMRERLHSHPVHPEPEGGYSVRQIQQLAHHLAERFGFRSLATAGGMPLADVWSALREAEVGLGAMAQALGWADGQLGSQRLGLAFELAKDYPNTHHAKSGHYDPDLAIIHIGRQGGWGSFAHEWAHALDEAVGLGWSPQARGLDRFASTHAEDAYALSDNPELEVFRSREVPVLTHGEALLALHQAIDGFAEQLQAFANPICLPHPDWEEPLAKRIAALRPWQEAVLSSQGNPRRWAEQWARWRQENEAIFGHAEAPAARHWYHQWNQTIEAAHRLFFGRLPGRPLWRYQSALRDEVEGQEVEEPETYWDTPHEAFARSLHAVVRDRIGTDTWVAESPLQMDVYPRGPDLAAVRTWWHTQKPLLLRHWNQPPVALRLVWGGQSVPLSLD